jgi:hypothetical protein
MISTNGHVLNDDVGRVRVGMWIQRQGRLQRQEVTDKVNGKEFLVAM